MNYILILSIFPTILIILILILIAVRIFYYTSKNHNYQIIDSNSIEKYFSTLLLNTDMSKLMLANTDNPDHGIINGTAGFLDIMRASKTINGKKLDRIKAEQIILDYKFNPANKSELEHFRYLTNLKLIKPTPENHELFRDRTATARFLEDMFTQYPNFSNKIFSRLSDNTIPQKNIIHELITHTHQGGYIQFMYKIVSDIFNVDAQNYIITSGNSHISIKTINSHTIQFKYEINAAPIYITQGLDEKLIDNITYSISFTMSSAPGNIFSSISYKDIKFRLDLPKTITGPTTNLKPVKRTQENANRAILINRSTNSLVYQLPDFTSPGLLNATYQDTEDSIAQKILQNKDQNKADTVQYQR